MSVSCAVGVPEVFEGTVGGSLEANTSMESLQGIAESSSEPVKRSRTGFLAAAGMLESLVMFGTGLNGSV